jgi:hypothetical protein
MQKKLKKGVDAIQLHRIMPGSLREWCPSETPKKDGVVAQGLVFVALTAVSLWVCLTEMFGLFFNKSIR